MRVMERTMDLDFLQNKATDFLLHLLQASKAPRSETAREISKLAYHDGGSNPVRDFFMSVAISGE